MVKNLDDEEKGPEVTIRKIENNYIEFELVNVTPAFANSVRRAILSEVPTLAFDEVIISENGSVLFDEVLAHRISLIPLRVGEETYEALRECYEEGKRDECTVLFTLEVEANERPVTVLSGHLRYVGGYGLPEGVELEVEPVSDIIPIVKLGRGQKIVLEAIAKMGTGKEHAKWQPVSIAAYKYRPKVSVLKQPEGDMAENIATICPKKVFEIRENRLVVSREEECSLCKECVEKFPGIISVGWETSHILFRVEGLGVIPVEKIIDVALETLGKRLTKFLSVLEETIHQ